MTSSPVWRTRIFATGAAVVALWLGGEIAQGSFLWPVAITVTLLMIALARAQPIPLSTLTLGSLLVGYIVGNRGFAQLSLAGGLPLFPAEAALLLLGSILAIQSAWRRELPLRRDFLNLVLLAWMTLGTMRLVPDFRTHGFLALRDFAVVYYAAFFYLGQAAATADRDRRFLVNSLLFGCAALLPVYEAFVHWPNFFVHVLTLRGNPLIFFKDDLAGTFLAVGSVLFFFRYENTRAKLWLALSLLIAAATLATGNRASLLGLVVSVGWLALRGRWRFGVVLAASGSAAAIILVGAAILQKTPVERTTIYGIYERVASIADLQGNKTYSSEGITKADNNRFRMVWWRAVIDETIDTNPYIGLGFGHDLAARFLREYYPDDSEDFTARSPHNVLLTIFGRMGVIGLGVFVLIVAAMARETWRAIGARTDTAPLWCAAWVILVSACFGVVLEGPMGAVVFWIVLGLAHGTDVANTTQQRDSDSETREIDSAALPIRDASVSADGSRP